MSDSVLELKPEAHDAKVTSEGGKPGFVYFNFGKPYLDEAAASIRTLIDHNPKAKVCLITDEAGMDYWRKRYSALPLERLLCAPIPKEEPLWVFRTNLYDLTPYDPTLFLDSDTCIADKIDDLFDLTETFEFVMVPDESHPARGTILGLKGGYAALNYYNCGFMLFRKTAAVAQLFREWRREYLELAPLEPSDQGALVRALIKTPVRFITLPQEYNLRLIDKCASFQDRAKIIHGRAKDTKKLARMLNDIEFISQGSRVWIPNLQRVLRASDFRLWGRLLQLLNRDNVQQAAACQITRKSVTRNLGELTHRLLWRLLHRNSCKPKSCIPAVSDEAVVDYLQTHYCIHSCIDCRPEAEQFVQGWQKRGIAVRPMPVMVNGSPCLRAVDGKRGSVPGVDPPSESGVDLVWCGSVEERLPANGDHPMVETVIRYAGRLIVMTLVPAQISKSPNPYLNDWRWVQILTDRGFYFDPHLTIALRNISNDPDFRQRGLVFERVTSRCGQAEYVSPARCGEEVLQK